MLIVDDHPLYRRGTRSALEGEEGVEVVGAVGTGREAIEVCRSLSPDVVLLDINLPDSSGIDVAKAIKAEDAAVEIVALTAHDDEQYILPMIRSGARGYLLKTATDAEIVSSVRAVSAGGSVFATEVTEALLLHASDLARIRDFGLTNRESQVLKHVANGLTNREIGAEMSISERTAQAHLSRIYDKLGVTSRTKAVALALQEGLIQVPDQES